MMLVLLVMLAVSGAAGTACDAGLFQVKLPNDPHWVEPLGSNLEAKALKIEPSGVTLGVKMDALWAIGNTSYQISMFL